LKGRSSQFLTPAGNFSYRQLSTDRFSVGLTLEHDKAGRWFMAETLKALADKVWCDPRCRPPSAAYFHDYLFADLRIDEHQLILLYHPFLQGKCMPFYSENGKA